MRQKSAALDEKRQPIETVQTGTGHDRGNGVICHDAPAAGHFFGSAGRWRFGDVEDAVEHEAGKVDAPITRRPIADAEALRCDANKQNRLVTEIVNCDIGTSHAFCSRANVRLTLIAR